MKSLKVLAAFDISPDRANPYENGCSITATASMSGCLNNSGQAAAEVTSTNAALMSHRFSAAATCLIVWYDASAMRRQNTVKLCKRERSKIQTDFVEKDTQRYEPKTD